MVCLWFKRREHKARVVIHATKQFKLKTHRNRSIVALFDNSAAVHSFDYFFFFFIVCTLCNTHRVINNNYFYIFVGGVFSVQFGSVPYCIYIYKQMHNVTSFMRSIFLVVARVLFAPFNSVQLDCNCVWAKCTLTETIEIYIWACKANEIGVVFAFAAQARDFKTFNVWSHRNAHMFFIIINSLARFSIRLCFSLRFQCLCDVW